MLYRRRHLEPVLRQLAADYPVVQLTGPRQSGKTTLCRQVFDDLAYVSLVLEASFLVFRARPWIRNFRKQLFKSPKLHFLDSGLA